MYVIIWEFMVRPECVADFERAYGRNGDWVRFFGGEHEYEGTELLKDPENAFRYVTIDRWESASAYHAFRKKQRNEYAALDRRFQQWTTRETFIGSFTTL